MGNILVNQFTCDEAEGTENLRDRRLPANAEVMPVPCDMMISLCAWQVRTATVGEHWRWRTILSPGGTRVTRTLVRTPTSLGRTMALMLARWRPVTRLLSLSRRSR